MKLLTDVKKLNTAIAGIRRSGQTLDKNIHLCAVSALHHAMTVDGNLTPLSRLALALPKSGRRKAFIFWATQFAPVTYNAKEEKFSKSKGKNPKVYNRTAAEDTPFWDYTVERKPSTVTLEGIISSVVKRVQAGIEKGDIKKEDITNLEKGLHKALVA